MATENVTSGRGGPFAAVIARGDEVVAKGVNMVTATNDPTAHAEVVAIREACRVLGGFQLPGCAIYTTCEPCPMCLGAIYWARLDRIFYGNTREDAARAGFDDSLIYREIGLPIEERHIPMHPCLREEALASFQAWQQFQWKIPY